MYTRLSYLSTGVFVFRGIMQTKYIGEQNPSPDCDILYAPVNGEFPEAKCFLYQMNRIYNDEVTRPDEKFITDRVVKYLAPKWDYWCGKAMTSWANLLPTI